MASARRWRDGVSVSLARWRQRVDGVMAAARRVAGVRWTQSIEPRGLR